MGGGGKSGGGQQAAPPPAPPPAAPPEEPESRTPQAVDANRRPPNKDGTQDEALTGLTDVKKKMTTKDPLKTLLGS